MPTPLRTPQLRFAEGIVGPLPWLTGTFPFFEDLVSRPDVVAAYTLRDDAEVLKYTRSKFQPRNIIYDPAGDTDPRAQNAAKIVVPAGKVSLPNQVRLPIPDVRPQSVLTVWDVWWGSEFSFLQSGVGHYKTFQFASPGGQIWTEVQSNFKDGSQVVPPGIATAHIRAYGEIKDGELGPNVTDDNPLSPMVNQFTIKPETWTRYWIFFNPVGVWFEFSYWMGDAATGAVLLNDRLQMIPAPNAYGWEKLWIEYNTSSLANPPADRVGYIRNVVMLKGLSLAQVTPLLTTTDL